MLGHHWGKCQISLVLASGVQMRKEGAQRLCLLTKKTHNSCKMQISVKIPKSTFLQFYAHFHKGPLSVLFQEVLGYEEMKSGFPSTVTVKFLLCQTFPQPQMV